MERNDNLDTLRQRVEELYIQENRPLKDVIAMLQKERGCTASKNMYLKKINAWGFKKNKTLSRMQQLANAMDQNPAESMKIGKLIVNKKEISRYLEKKKDGQDNYSTIVALAKASQPRSLERHPSVLIRQTRTLSLPDPLFWQNRLFRAIHDFNARVLQNLAFPSTMLRNDQGNLTDPAYVAIVDRRKNYDRASSETFLTSITSGASMLAYRDGKGDPSSVGVAHLERGFRVADKVLLHAHPNTLASIFIILALLQKNKSYPFIESLTRYLFQLSRVLLGPQHDVCRLVEGLYHCYSSSMLQAAASSCSDMVSSMLGAHDVLSMEYRLVAATVTKVVEPFSHQTCQRFESLLKDVKHAVPYKFELECQVRQRYVPYLIDLKQYHRAAEVALEPFPWIFDIEWAEFGDDMFAMALMLNSAASAAMELARFEAAGDTDHVIFAQKYIQCEYAYRRVLEEVSVQFPPDSYQVAGVKTLHMYFHETWGSMEEAWTEYEDVNKLMAEYKLSD